MWEEPVHRGTILVSVFALLILSAMSLLRANSVRAGTEFTVDDTADALDANPGDGACATSGGGCTLRAAIMETNALAGDDTIILPSGVYALTIGGSGEDMATLGDLDITDDLTVEGAGAANTIVDGNGDMIQDRVVHVLGEGVQLTINNVEMRNGGGVIGSGIKVEGPQALLRMKNSVIADHASIGIEIRQSSTSIFTNCVVARNAAYGINIVEGSQLSASGTLIQDNQSSGIYSQAGITLESCVIRRNHGSGSNGGGGICNFGGTAILTNSSVTGNTSEGNGGGIMSGGPLTLTNSTVSGNRAYGAGWGEGGGLWIGGSLELVNSTVSSNTATAGGGGIAVSGAVRVINSTISNNRSNDSGAGVALLYTDGSFYLNNATVTSNIADLDGDGSGDGGGIFAYSGLTGNAANSIIAGNIDNSPGTGNPDCSGTLISQGYNLVGDTAGCFIGGDTTGHLTGVAPLLDPLKDNGGPTLTHALLPGSSAIDAGNPAGCSDHEGNPLLTDQRGMPRLGRCDMGAYEATPRDPYRKTASPSAILPGDPLTYTISFENLETVDITDVRVTDTLPTLVTYLDNSLTATGGSYGYADGVVTWTGTVSAGGSVAVRFGVTVSQMASLGSSISNSAVISGGGEIITRTATVFVGHQIYLPLITKGEGWLSGLPSRRCFSASPAQRVHIMAPRWLACEVFELNSPTRAEPLKVQRLGTLFDHTCLRKGRFRRMM